jgi:thiol-disulfide isomerase/thioredoxin
MEVKMIKKIAFSFVVVTLLLAACAPSAPASDTSMQKTAEGMADKSAESMAEKPTEAMMDKTAEAEMAKPEEMMDKSTDADMAKPAEMMDESTDADMAKPEEMMDESTETEMAKPEEMMDESSDSDMEKSEEMMDGKTAESPAWFNVPLTNVRSGENFTISGYKGKVVLVETLAMWCPNCKKQQGQVAALHEMLGMDADLVTIGLDVDKNEMAADLKAYTDKNGFDWVYAVAPVDVAREIGNLYGQQFLNPSSTPMLVVDRKGQAHPMPFGIKSAEDLKQFVEPFLSDQM